MDLALGISLLALFCSLLLVVYQVFTIQGKNPRTPEDSENVYASKAAEKAAAKKSASKNPEIEKTMKSIDDFRK